MSALLLSLFVGVYTDVGYVSTTGTDFTGNVKLGVGTRLIYDDDEDTYDVSTTDDSVSRVVNGNSRLTVTGTTITFGTFTTTGNGVDVDFTPSDYMRLPDAEGAAPAPPLACSSSSHKWAIVGVDDTDDSAATRWCYCGMTDDTTYAWLFMDDNSDCNLGTF